MLDRQRPKVAHPYKVTVRPPTQHLACWTTSREFGGLKGGGCGGYGGQRQLDGPWIEG